MTLPDINSKITFLTGADTTAYANTDRLININEWQRNIVTIILRSQDDWDFDDSNKSDYPILTNNLVLGQQDYQLPTGTLQLKRVEISFDGTNWYVANRFDIGMRRDPTSANSLGDFAKTSPFYDVQFNSVFLYPIPDANVTGGIKIWIERPATEFSTGDLSDNAKSPGFDSQFHQLLAWGAALDYAVAKNLSNREALKRGVDEMTAQLMTFYGRKVADAPTSMQTDFSSNNYGR